MPLSDSASLRRIFDAIPVPILILGTEYRVLDHNLAAGEILTLTQEQAPSVLCGESLGCIHVEQSPAGCGSGAPCATCVLRLSVRRAGAGQRTVRQPTRMLLRRDTTQQHQPVDFLVSASPLSHEGETLVLMMLEDVTASGPTLLTDLRRIIPICAQCGKMRDDDQHWQSVQDYLTRYTQVRFTHGLCPDCLHTLYPDMYGPP